MVGGARWKLNEPTETRSAVWPGYELAGTISSFRKGCLAWMWWMAARSGTMKRAPPGALAPCVHPPPAPPAAPERGDAPVEDHCGAVARALEEYGLEVAVAIEAEAVEDV